MKLTSDKADLDGDSTAVVKIEYNKTSPMWADPHETTSPIDSKRLVSCMFSTI